MARCKVVFIVGAGLCLVLVPACARNRGSLRPGMAEVGTRAAPVPVTPPHIVASNSAPPTLPSLLPAPGLVTDEAPIEQARYPQPPEHEPPVRPAALNPPPVAGPTLDEPQPKPIPEPPLLAALRCYLNRRPTEAVQQLERYDRPNQEMLLALLPLASLLTETSLNKANPQQVAAVMAQLQSLLVPLRKRADLVIDKMCFCSRIDRFGVYEPLPPDYAFRPGERVELYVEVQNFTSEPDGPRYVTRLISSAEIKDFAGEIVQQYELKDKEKPDYSRTPRHDFYNKYTIPLPHDLRPNSYTLWIVVTDVPTGRTDRRSLDFRVTTLPARPASN